MSELPHPHFRLERRLVDAEPILPLLAAVRNVCAGIPGAVVRHADQGAISILPESTLERAVRIAPRLGDCDESVLRQGIAARLPASSERVVHANVDSIGYLGHRGRGYLTLTLILGSQVIENEHRSAVNSLSAMGGVKIYPSDHPAHWRLARMPVEMRRGVMATLAPHIPAQMSFMPTEFRRT